MDVIRVQVKVTETANNDSRCNVL